MPFETFTMHEITDIDKTTDSTKQIIDLVNEEYAIFILFTTPFLHLET